MNVTWLASYPKSGNTWLRFFLYNYIHGEVRKSEDIARKIPDIHTVRSLNTASQEMILCKTHFMCTDNHPYLKETSGFIYILRHPKDVLMSNLNYFRLIGNDQVGDEEFALKFIKNFGVQRWQGMGMGNWVEHADSWLAQPRFPHIMLRYETMLQSPHDCLRQVIEFLDLDVNEKKLNRAVHLSSFSKVKNLEEKEKAKGRYSVVFAGTPESTKFGHRFMSKGKSRQSLTHISDHVEEMFNARFKDVLSKYGYE